VEGLCGVVERQDKTKVFGTFKIVAYGWVLPLVFSTVRPVFHIFVFESTFMTLLM